MLSVPEVQSKKNKLKFVLFSPRNEMCLLIDCADDMMLIPALVHTFTLTHHQNCEHIKKSSAVSISFNQIEITNTNKNRRHSHAFFSIRFYFYGDNTNSNLIFFDFLFLSFFSMHLVLISRAISTYFFSSSFVLITNI